MSNEEKLEEIAKRRGFFWQTSEIYGGVSGYYTYGPLGALLKLRIERLLRDYYVIEENCFVIEAPTMTIEDLWVASGHIEGFLDRMTKCTKCGEPYRVDHLIEEQLGKRIEELDKIKEIVLKGNVKCPKCKSRLDENVYDYNLMFKTFIGPGKRKVTGYMRPETAQTTYQDFRRLFEIARKKTPFGVIQFGKSFRNEISPRQGLVRLREFSQAEAQFFVNPKHKNEHPKFKEVEKIKVKVFTKKSKKETSMSIGDLVKKEHTNKRIAYYLAKSVQLFQEMGIDCNKLRLRQHGDDERSFYSSDTWDVEFKSKEYGQIELVGIADRTDYDLSRHMELSKQSMEVNIDGDKFVPHIIEVAYGIDRPLYCVLESCLKKDKDRTIFSFPPKVAPYQVAVFPLVSKDKLPDKAKEVYYMLNKEGFYALYDETGSIGKRYYRQDEAGTNLCVTVDYDSLKNNDVTIRDRDSKKQIRVNIKDSPKVLTKFFNGKKLEKLGNLI